MASLPIVVQATRSGVTEEQWVDAGVLPCLLSVDVPLKNFTVRDLLQLETGSIVESRNVNGADVPVVVNTKLIGWAEFEVVGHRLAIRLTELV